MSLAALVRPPAYRAHKGFTATAHQRSLIASTGPDATADVPGLPYGGLGQGCSAGQEAEARRGDEEGRRGRPPASQDVRVHECSARGEKVGYTRISRPVGSNVERLLPDVRLRSLTVLTCVG